MADFKSDNVDAASTSAYLPTGAVIMLGGPFSDYSDSYYTNLGLVPCDGRSLNGVSSIYSNLWAVIGTTFGGTGQSSFQVPNLTSIKKSVIGTSGTYARGSSTNTSSHGHTATLNYTSNSANETHSHSATTNIGNVSTSNTHRHNLAAYSMSIGTNTNASNYSTAGSGNQTALVPGSHNHRCDFNAFNTDDRGTEGSHSHGGSATGNTGNNTATTTHSHAISSVTATFPTDTFDGTGSNPLETPYANVLYFIRI
jgi:microcystin-dependent protein